MFDCFYVKLPNDYITITKLVSNQGEYGSFVVDGFFYLVSQKNEMKSINIVLLLTTGYSFSLGCDVHNGLSLRECIDRKMNVNSYVYKVMNLFMQIILYMSAVNADVEEDSEQKEIRERAVKKEASEEKTNQTDKKTTNNEISYRELQKWNVGYRYGSAVKKARQAERKKRDINTEQEQTARQGSHSRKRTHARRGHFHHFWTGSRNGERHLIVKWVSPIIVNAEYDNIVTIRKVK